MSKRKATDPGPITVLTREEYLRQQAANTVDMKIRLTNNYAFKKVFRNPVVLKGYLMALLHLREEDIQRIDLTDPFEEGESIDEKEGILNFNLTLSPGFHHEYHLREQKTGEIYSSKIGIHVIELRKVTDGLPDDANEYEKELHRWSSIMAAESWEEMEEMAKGNPYMEAAEEEMRKISLDEKQRYLYLREEMAYIDRLSQIATAKDEGRDEGRVEGRVEGRIEGIYLDRIAKIRKKLAKSKSLEATASELEEALDTIRPIYELIQTSPELTDQEIYDKLFSKPE